MFTFLDIVAQDLYAKTGGNFSDTVIVFPNKRASLFFNKALTRLTDKPIWSPQYTTISELFRQYSTMETGDRIKLVCDLYLSYTEVTGANEPLDSFYGWGELMLNDFDDIDKPKFQHRTEFHRRQYQTLRKRNSSPTSSNKHYNAFSVISLKNTIRS